MSAWNADSRDGGPTSMDVLLQWVKTPGNFARWLERDELLTVLVGEIVVALERHGITYRSAGSIMLKLWWIVNRYNKANEWLKKIGVQDIDSEKLVEHEVLRICPVYREVAPVIRSTRPITPKRYQSNSIKTKCTKAKNNPGYHWHDDSKQPQSNVVARRSSVGCKREAVDDPRGTTKHVEIEDWGVSPQIGAHGIERVAVCEAEESRRRELFSFELQAKRDQAVYVRARARKELLEMGFSRSDVDRLLPLMTR